MKPQGKVMVVVFVFATAALVLTGCGGIQAQHTVSPATFLIPGVIKADPAPPQRPDMPEPAKQFALAQ